MNLKGNPEQVRDFSCNGEKLGACVGRVHSVKADEVVDGGRREPSWRGPTGRAVNFPWASRTVGLLQGLDQAQPGKPCDTNYQCYKSLGIHHSFSPEQEEITESVVVCWIGTFFC